MSDSEGVLKLRLDFSGVIAEVSTSCPDLLQRLRQDFSQFIAPAAPTPVDFEVRAFLSFPPAREFQKLASGIQTKNARVIDQGSVRLSSYQNEALCRLDFSTDQAEVHSPILHRLHEVTYLLILSRVGKLLDLRGLHRLHAMGVELNDHTVLCTLPMGGGKTTLFLSLLGSFPNARPISDDSPLITRSGAVRPFAVRVGIKGNIQPGDTKLSSLNWEKVYSLDRMQYGPKWLFPISSFKNQPCVDPPKKLVLFTGKQTGTPITRIRKISFWRIYPEVFVSMVIGVGLPIMREHFVEMSFKDSLRLVKIIFSRVRASLAMTLKAEKFFIELSTDFSQNAKKVESLLAGLETSRSLQPMSPEQSLPHTSA